MSRLRGRELLTALISRQHLESVVPRALEVVADEPLIMVHNFYGDLLRGLMDVPDEFWRRHPNLYEQYRSAVRSAAQARLKLPAETRLAFWSPLEIQGMLATSSGTSAPRPELDEVNDASFDSFPASDPPPWSSMHAGAPPSMP